MDSDQPDNNTLWSTNKLLSDLERKLSIVSNTSSSSNQTQQSHNSSVIVDRSISGIGKQNVQSSVLQYIKENENAFNPNELFEERQQKFLTKLGRTYNDDKYALKNNHEKFVTNVDFEDDGAYIDDKNEANIYDLKVREDQLLYASRVNVTPEMNYDDEDDTYVDDGDGNDKIFFDDDDENLLLSPEPPRSPPREIDPDKVYGLYDFSGPDPLHCTLLRDEPVYLINDEDDYWCLIRKLSKEERMAVVRMRINGDQTNTEDPFGDMEYSKVGFVPAECLETYGERLARLNCFKNEELEKISRETLDNNDSIQILEHESLHSDEKSEHSNISQESIPTTGLVRRNTKTNKSVTFEDLGILDFYDQDEDNTTNKETSEFGQHFLNISHDELQSLSLPRNDDDKTSEVLSDVYPIEMPLIINKSNDKKSLINKKTRNNISLNENDFEEEPDVNNSPEIIEILDADDDAEINHIIHVKEDTTDKNSSNNNASNIDKNDIINVSDESLHGSDNEVNDIMLNNPYSEFSKPPTVKQGHQDNSSIGSFSPDTPPQGKKFSSSTFGIDEQISDDEANLSTFRRSNVLDRLNKITSDIQEQLKLNDYDSYNDETNFLVKTSPKISSDLKSMREENSDDDNNEYDFDDYDDYDDYDDDYYYRNESDQDDQRYSEGVGVITPLTSSNSLSNGMAPINTDLVDKRNSKPVHDMFIPVLGKFDLLAEKLARLDELI